MDAGFSYFLRMNFINYHKIIFYSLFGTIVLGGLLFYMIYFQGSSLKFISEEIYNQKLELEILKEQSKTENSFQEEARHSFPLLDDMKSALIREESLVKFLEKIETFSKKYNLSQEISLKREEPQKKQSQSKTDEDKSEAKENESSTSKNDSKNSQLKIPSEVSPTVDLEIFLNGEFQDIMYYLIEFEKLESLPEVIYYEWQREEQFTKDKTVIILPQIKFLIKAKLFASMDAQNDSN